MAKTAEIRYTYGAGLTSETKAEGTYYYHFNNIGSTTEITDTAGAVKYRITYGPYGELTGIKDGNQNEINIADEDITPFLYNGQLGVQTDQNGLYYMRARYYNTDIKRFINRDTVSGDLTNSQSLNKYSYVQGNPVNQTDPFGLSPMGGDVMSILSQLGHTALAIGGFFWDGFDLINAVWYAAEGNTLMAMSCGVAAIPFLGSVASKGVSKIAFKVLKSADKASDLVKAAKLSKAAGYINDISKLVGYTGMATLGAIDTAYAYQDYEAAKANGEDATLELCSVILNGAFTVCSGIRAVSSAAKVTARLKADGVGDAVKAAAKNAMSGIAGKGYGGGSKSRLNTYGDALREKLGPAYLSHPEEYNAILNRANKMGVSVEFRAGTLAYDMELGKPGKLIIDPEASIGALRHEYRHMLDDFSLGHPGMKIIADSEKFWELEFRGYLEELNLAREIKEYDAAKFIIDEMRLRRMEILGK